MNEKTETKKLNLKGWWWKFPLMAVLIFLGVTYFFGSSSLPECGSSNAKKTLSKAFDQSQFARTLNLSVVQISETKELPGSTEEQRKCNASVVMNNANTVSVDYRMDLRDNGQYLLEFKIQE